MKRKLICWLPLLLLIGCSQPTYRTTSLTPDKRAELLLKELTLEEKVNPEKPYVPLNKNDAFQKVQKRRVQKKR